MAILDDIQRLSNERQALWRLAGKRPLSLEQRERIQIIGKRLDELWHQHRCEVAAQAHLVRKQPGRVADYSDLLHRNQRSRRGWWDKVYVWEDTGRSRSKTEHEAMKDIQADVGAKPVERAEGIGDALAQFGVDVLREVLAELRKPDFDATPHLDEQPVIDTAI